MLQLPIFLLSAAALAYEVLLLRVFSYTLWHHFAATVIGLALLGYGASGSLLSIAQGWLLPRFALVFRAAAVLFGLAALACLSLAQSLPFNPLALVWEARQWVWFLVLCLLFSVPFFLGASCVGLAFRLVEGRVHGLYRADLLGAGVGAGAAIGLLHVAEPGFGFRLVAGAGFLAAVLAGMPAGAARGRVWVRGGCALLGVLVAAAWPGSWIRPGLSEYKDLSQALRVTGAVLLQEQWSPLGHVAVVDSPAVPFRHAPGLSLLCPHGVPPHLGLFLDGDLAGAIAQGGDDGFFDCLPVSLPLRLVPSPRVLVLGLAGGGEVRGALRAGAASVEAIELNPDVVAAARRFSADSVLEDPRVRVRSAEARAFLASSAGGYDLIQLALAGSGGGGLGGGGAVAENYLYTVEALRLMLERLAPGGYLAITQGLQMPPRGALKLFATAVESLRGHGVGDPGEHLALFRTWNTVTLLVGDRPLGASAAAVIRSFCAERGFDLAYLPGIRVTEANRFNLLREPVLYQGAQEILGGGAEDFFDRYKFRIRPATDDRPFFFHSFKWRSLPELVRAVRRGGSALVEWGYLLAVVAFGQTLLLGGGLILLPLRWLGKGRPIGGGRRRVAVYFGGIGLAFIFVEVAALSRFTLLLGHPVYAAALVLGVFLLSAGLGSGFSGRVAHRFGCRRAMRLTCLGSGALALIVLSLLPRLLPVVASLPPVVGWAAAVGAIVPVAFAMGMPFPLGLRQLGDQTPDWVPWAWGINGFASVWSATLAALLALHLGFGVVLAAAAAAYLAAAWAGWGMGESEG